MFQQIGYEFKRKREDNIREDGLQKKGINSIYEEHHNRSAPMTLSTYQLLKYNDKKRK